MKVKAISLLADGKKETQSTRTLKTAKSKIALGGYKV